MSTAVAEQTEEIAHDAIWSDDLTEWVEHLKQLLHRIGKIQHKLSKDDLLNVIHDVGVACVKLGESGHSPDWPEQQLGASLAELVAKY